MAQKKEERKEKPEPLMKPLPGSKYLRGRCSSCKEPMRVVCLTKDSVCSVCSGEARLLSIVAESGKNRGLRKKLNTTK